jgi:hypothetical protein
MPLVISWNVSYFIDPSILNCKHSLFFFYMVKLINNSGRQFKITQCLIRCCVSTYTRFSWFEQTFSSIFSVTWLISEVLMFHTNYIQHLRPPSVLYHTYNLRLEFVYLIQHGAPLILYISHVSVRPDSCLLQESNPARRLEVLKFQSQPVSHFCERC